MIVLETQIQGRCCRAFAALDLPEIYAVFDAAQNGCAIALLYLFPTR